MRWLIIILGLLASATSIHAMEDGTLLFVENGQNLVECYTHSKYSHVAIVIDDHVYEANPPMIQKHSLLEWFTNIGKHNEGTASPALVVVMLPDKPYSEKEIGNMREYLEKQVGRRYSVKGYLRKIPGDGIHCSEMCASALEASGRCDFPEPNCTYSPRDLHEFIADYHQFGKKLYVRIKGEYRRPVTSRWKDWWKHKSSMCGWSCIETMTFCW